MIDIDEVIAKGEEFNINETESMFAKMQVCQDACAEYNQMKPSDFNGRTAKIKQIFKKTGEMIWVASPVYCGMGEHIEVGNNFFVNPNCFFMDLADIKFGDNVWIGPNVGFYTSGHSIDPNRREAGYGYAFPITVGDNVWFGAGSIVVPSRPSGITIGKNSVIAAGTVVNKDVPENVLVAGNPVRIIREI